MLANRLRRRPALKNLGQRLVCAGLDRVCLSTFIFHFRLIVLWLPMVALNVALNSLLQNLWIKLLLPTPESPTNTTLNTLCGALDSSSC